MSTPEVIVLSSDDESEMRRSKRPRTTLSSPPTSPPSKRRRRREVLLYLNDDCVVTEGLMELLMRMPQVRCCVTQPSFYPFHIQQNDKWSCGFRNLQMIMTFMIPYLPKDHSFLQYTTPLSSSYEIPSVLQWQQSMEAAWNEGFDADGGQHYRLKIVGKAVWIGAVEVASVLAFGGIDATVVQFIRCAASRRQLMPFCVTYFQRHYCHCHDDSTNPCSSLELVRHLLQETEMSKKSSQPESSCKCDIPPLYLQWKGHSVCVVGYEVETQANGTLFHHLLAFDPMKRGSVLTKSLQRNDLKPFRVDHAKLERQDCQVVLCSTRTLPASVRECIKHRLQTATAAERAVLETLHKSSR
ncbi:hypothetical protein FisN_6Lh251 [Fistulifera solaris]|uniref:UFSP1/2/DUB catalytic domain-containing protein n=1 Tax=Fistulifera solaris TaxID=1519565 RepID=A0A1Z5J5V2_FISSO|nr:hypothetical protein FisN_6Lh251 [Fistulifera solaris]|eukprot:GAX09375.1 hypothetical protein FisN_6Lh251 [Fistulifera solaris]